ncbi:hypothetical protein HYH03_005505 [Edaphochlamys debaryana]|uniref:Uncharacterized protein n=1 Tax=Edaphochlamys debaryana TaxID=47281 RepID=A0A836C1X0_9CHLO|nr:hypothetical protein HYH03_005505 [Edaphochlamys debaryana]|eukprot:KAG2496272.1 hypothetical protein HYH03_005505 [Edaphochlamys debaryana]
MTFACTATDLHEPRGYYSSFNANLLSALLELSPRGPGRPLTVRLNLNESLLRRMEPEGVLEALRKLREGRPGLVVEFNTGHTFFGFRTGMDPATLSFLAGASWIRSVGFSLGLHSRRLEGEAFLDHLAGSAAAEAAEAAAARAAEAAAAARREGEANGAAGAGGGAAGRSGSGEVAGWAGRAPPAAAAIEALSLTHYEAAERPPVAPVLRGLHHLIALRTLTLDCEIALSELAPLANCPGLESLTIDMLVSRPHQARPAGAGGAGAAGAGAGPAHPPGWPLGYDLDLGVALPPPPPLGTGVPEWILPPPMMAAAAVLPGPPLPCLLGVVRLTLGSESHPAAPLSAVFPALQELTCVASTRKVGIYNVFPCRLMLAGLGPSLRSLTLAAVMAAEAPAALSAASSLTSLAFTHSDSASTAGLLAAAAALPDLRRLAVWDHEDADEYLDLEPLLNPLPQPEAQWALRPRSPGPGLGPSRGEAEAGVVLAAEVRPPPPFAALRELEVKATSPEFFAQFTRALRHRPGPGPGPGSGCCPRPESEARGEPGADGASQEAPAGLAPAGPRPAGVSSDAAGCDVPAGLAPAGPRSEGAAADPGQASSSGRTEAAARAEEVERKAGTGAAECGDGDGGRGWCWWHLAGPRLRRVRLDACFDPPLLRVGAGEGPDSLGALLAALGPGVREAVVSGWATPGSEAAILSLGRQGRGQVGGKGRGKGEGLVVEYEYPLL